MILKITGYCFIILGIIGVSFNLFSVFKQYGMRNTGYYRYTIKYRYNKDSLEKEISNQEIQIAKYKKLISVFE